MEQVRVELPEGWGDELAPDLTLTRAELEVVAVLQHNPRMPWSTVARILGTSPQSVAGTWASLVDRGLAWSTLQHSGVGPDRVTAFLGVHHAPDASGAVRRELLTRPHVQSVDVFAQGCDMVCTVVAPTLPALMRDVVDPLRAVNGISRVETWFVTRVHRAGYQHFERVLTEDQARRAAEHAVEPDLSGGVRGQDRAVVSALMADARAGATDIARLTGMSTSTAHRHLGAVLRSSGYHLRVFLSHAAVGSPVVCQWFARVPGDAHLTAARALQRLPALHLLASVTGRANFVIALALPSLAQVPAAERAITTLVPGIELEESLVTLSSPKRWGWLLDAAGRRTGEFVEPPIW